MAGETLFPLGRHNRRWCTNKRCADANWQTLNLKKNRIPECLIFAYNSHASLINKPNRRRIRGGPRGELDRPIPFFLTLNYPSLSVLRIVFSKTGKQIGELPNFYIGFTSFSELIGFSLYLPYFADEDRESASESFL